MATRIKKSLAYYVLIGCILLITASGFFAMVWQPSFEQGYISIPALNGAFVFSLWLFLPACLSLLFFGWAVSKTVKSSYQKRPFVFAITLGLFAVVFCSLLSFHAIYGSARPNDKSFGKALLYYRIILATILLLIILLLSSLFYKRRSLLKN